MCKKYDNERCQHCARVSLSISWLNVRHREEITLNLGFFLNAVSNTASNPDTAGSMLTGIKVAPISFAKY